MKKARATKASRTTQRLQQNPVVASGLEYQVNIAFDPRDIIYVARVPELEGCHTRGDTPEQALKHAQEAIELWLATARERDKVIPEPLSRRIFSGKFVLRTSSNLHAELAQMAAQHGKSLNEMVVELIEKGLRHAG